MAAVTAMILTYYLGPRFINWLRKLNFQETIRSDGPQTHHKKAGTPTMGGIIMLFNLSISFLLWGNLGNFPVLLAWLTTLTFGLLGFYDDYSKAVLKVKNGVSARFKFIVQILISLIFATIYYLFIDTGDIHKTSLYLPFLKDPLFEMGLLAIPFWVFLITGFSNAVNLTDGLDGLATGLATIAMSTLGVLAYLTGVFAIADYLLIPYIPESNELTILLGAFVGAGIGFLWYNSHPAEVFMGDTGSLALGGIIGISAILIKREILLLILGGVFFAEALSVMLQVGYFKWKRKRIFLMAPLHHHCELKGWHENQVVVRFWIIGILLAMISFSSLKII